MVLGIAPTRHASRSRAAKPRAAPRRRRRRAARRRERREALAPLRKKIKDCERTIETLRAEIAALDKAARRARTSTRDNDRAADAREDARRARARFRARGIGWLDLSAELEAREAGEDVG